MAASYIPYRPERTNYQFTPAEPCQNLRQTAAQTTFTPNDNLRGALQDLTGVAGDLPTEEALCLEIEKLCTATLTIDEAFNDIGRRLSDVSKEQNKRADLDDTCRTLEAQWSDHHRTYKRLLWRSREFAGKAQGTVDDFRELVLPSLRDRERTRSEKQEIIREQIQVLQDTSQPSQNLCQEFLDFGGILDTYIAEFSRVVEGLWIGEQTIKVGGLEIGFQDARNAMDVVSREVKELGLKFAGDVAVAGIALLLAFVVPTLWATFVGGVVVGIECMNLYRSGPQLLEAWRRRNSAVTQHEAIKAEYDLEAACLGQMVKLETTLHDSRPLVQEVTAKLGIFVNVWAAITADMWKLEHSLHHAEDPTSLLFTLRVERLERMYGYLSQALRHYQVKVRLPQ